ncbi:MAG: sodium:calcium antiporter [Blastocatellia bacterium]|nr:sodium:calcium antiporter [Blastocatellia bacterium]
MLVWLQFLACTAVIVFSGTRLSKYGDCIAEKTGMGRTWVGVILIASVTSLPELITGISSVTLFGLPDIAAGDVLGSCMFNILIIALLDLIAGSPPISTRAHQGQVLTAGFGILLLGLVSLSISTGARLPAVGWVGAYSFVFLGVYILTMRLVFFYEKRRVAEFIEELQYDHITKRKAYIMYALNALVIIAAATYLPHLGERIAEMTGLGRTFVGSFFIAFSTSLPELVVSITALRIGAIDMVYGNLFGSNLFNIAVLAIDDFLYTKGPLISDISANHIISANAAMALTAIAVIGLTYKTTKKRLFLAWESLGIIIVYVLASVLLYLTR